LSAAQRQRIGLDIPTRTTLVPDQPTAPQREIPGLF
jgi:hypothetical protein